MPRFIFWVLTRSRQFQISILCNLIKSTHKNISHKFTIDTIEAQTILYNANTKLHPIGRAQNCLLKQLILHFRQNYVCITRQFYSVRSIRCGGGNGEYIRNIHSHPLPPPRAKCNIRLCGINGSISVRDHIINIE